MTRFKTRLKNASGCGMLGTMLQLMPCFAVLLLAAGCASPSQPSISSSQHGNAWLMTLPKGTLVEPLTEQAKAISVNEIKDGRVTGRVVIASDAYIKERDDREMQMLIWIETLQSLKK